MLLNKTKVDCLILILCNCNLCLLTRNSSMCKICGNIIQSSSSQGRKYLTGMPVSQRGCSKEMSDSSPSPHSVLVIPAHVSTHRIPKLLYKYTPGKPKFEDDDHPSVVSNTWSNQEPQSAEAEVSGHPHTTLWVAINALGASS